MKPIRHSIFALLILSPTLPGPWAQDVDSLENPQLVRQRSAFVAAEGAFAKHQSDRYLELKKRMLGRVKRERRMRRRQRERRKRVRKREI